MNAANLPRRSTKVGMIVQEGTYIGSFVQEFIWYKHEPESVVENEIFKILWDFTMQCDHMIEARRPDIAVVDKVKK